jgi:hypothetical protein
MSILNFDGPAGRKSGKPLKVLLGIGGLAAVVALASTLAAGININSGPVEFGQGVSETTACDDSLTITPNSKFDNSYGPDGDFLFSGFAISELDSTLGGCAGKTFTIKAYGETSSAVLAAYTFMNNGTSFSSDYGMTEWDNEGTENSSMELWLANPSVLASFVYKITIETSVGAAGTGDYEADYTSGSTVFDTTPLFSIDANSASPVDLVWSDTNTASTLDLSATANFTSGANSYVDFKNIEATADTGNSITSMDRVTVEFWVNFLDNASLFSAGLFSFDTTDDRGNSDGCGYNLSFNDGYLGINTCNSDTLGFLATNLNDAWHHIVWIASTGDRYTQKIYVDGQIRQLTRYNGGDNPDLQEYPRPNIGKGTLGINTWSPSFNELKVGAINIYAGEMPQVSIAGRSMLFQNRLT